MAHKPNKRRVQRKLKLYRLIRELVVADIQDEEWNTKWFLNIIANPPKPNRKLIKLLSTPNDVLLNNLRNNK